MVCGDDLLVSERVAVAVFAVVFVVSLLGCWAAAAPATIVVARAARPNLAMWEHGFLRSVGCSSGSGATWRPTSLELDRSYESVRPRPSGNPSRELRHYLFFVGEFRTPARP